MLEPPSHELVRQLTELQLCHPNDLRRARGRVRRLAFDLPAFDSVWIDSLVQLRLLTPYQAKQLEEGNADRLRIGSLVVIDELGRSDRGSTYLARRLHRRDRCVVKRQRVPADRVGEVSRQFQLVLERANGFAHPQIVLPHEILPATDHELITLSRLVPGLPLNELLVRRGRFPGAIVLEIGRQLLEGLAALHTRSLIHGDIRMSNVRLTQTGLAVLVDGGMRHVIHPEITIHDRLALEAYDGLAPELIGTGLAASASSELYAVGCLLWQLLAGRPPYANADPLAKIAAHQSQTIDDVRVLAPDTPVLLAETIRQMTSPSIHQRPRSFEEVLQRWGRPSSFSRSRLRQFRRLFDGTVPHFSGPGHRRGPSNWIWVAAALFAMTGGVAALYETGLRSELLEIVHRFKSSVPGMGDAAFGALNRSTNAGANGESTSTDRAPSLIPLPLPSPDGMILLNQRGPYAAGNISFAGDLTIRGALGVKPEIHVDNVPLSLTAQSIVLDQLTIRLTNATDPGSLVKTRCQQLKVQSCEFATLPTAASSKEKNSSNEPGVGAIFWKSMGSDPHSGTIVVIDTVFHGHGAAILLGQSPRHIQVSNTLKTGRGAFLSFGAKCLATQIKFDVDHTTLRESGPLVRLAGEFADKTGVPPFQIEANDCAFSLADSHAGFIIVETERTRADIRKSVELKAADSVIEPGTPLLVSFDAGRNRSHDEDADEQFEGLIISEIKFSGNRLTNASDAKTSGLKGPRSVENATLPGIEPRNIGPTGRTGSASATLRLRKPSID